MSNASAVRAFPLLVRRDGALFARGAALALWMIFATAQAQTVGPAPATPVSPVTVRGSAHIGGPPPPCAAAKGASGSTCAAAKLDAAAKAAGGSAPADPTLAVPGTGSSPITLGTPTTSSISQQFGKNFGKSVTHYRPPPPPPTPSPFARVPR
jgi:hypothetical protein